MPADAYICEEGVVELWLAGALSAQQEADFLQHVKQGCPTCEARINELRDLPGWLAGSVAQPPPRSLRDRVAQIGKSNLQPWRQWGPGQKDEVYVLREDEGEWATVKPGVHVKQLFADPVRDEVTMLIRMEPASTFPSHQHGGPEQCLVLGGQLIVGDLVLNQGDFQCAPDGSIHDVSRTDTGCFLLIVSSQKDRILA